MKIIAYTKVKKLEWVPVVMGTHTCKNTLEVPTSVGKTNTHTKKVQWLCLISMFPAKRNRMANQCEFITK